VTHVQTRTLRHFKCVAGFEHDFVGTQAAPRHMNIDAPTVVEREFNFFDAIEKTRMDSRILVDQQGAVSTIGRHDEL